MAPSISPKDPADADAALVRTADGGSDYPSSPMASATAPTHPGTGAPADRVVEHEAHAPDVHDRTHPRASTDVAPAASDEIVRAADGSSDYEHLDMAAAVDEAQHKRPT